jgi:ATP-binding cassette subfamily F protein 3
LSNHVVHVNAGRLTHYPGGYQYYLDKTGAQSARAALTSKTNGSTQFGQGGRAGLESGKGPAAGGSARKDQKRLEAEQRQAKSRERKKRHEAVQRLEAEIHRLEARQAELVAELEKPETYEQPGRAQEINRDLLHVQESLAELNPAWENAATELAALEEA